MIKFLQRVFGSRNDRVIKRLNGIVQAINELEPSHEVLSDAELKAKRDEFRQRIAQGASLDEILPEAFAVVREASKRVLKMRHFDVQLLGGIALHQGMISEMRTGEGKTLSATLPAYLNSLTGSVHIITINDYLAQRDADWMAPIYHFLGLSVGTVLSNQPHEEKKAAYAADITYGTNNEFGFDYLRDNMAFVVEEKVQRALNFAIVDEVDSILIDEARTPLIISGPVEDDSAICKKINAIVPLLVPQETEDGPGDYTVDEKSRQCYLTESGHQHVEEILVNQGLLQTNESLYDAANISLMHHLSAALRAHKLFQLNVDYIVSSDGQIVIVDEHTGRTMPGRRWSDGLHQAIEAKENVKIQNENQTLASITFQNYFRLYNKLSGMTGTADTEAPEFLQIYSLEVLVLPTNKPMIRKDYADQIYLTQNDKYEALIKDLQERHSKGQPILVGTVSIETSELLSTLLTKHKIKHQILNAKFHAKEAEIIAQAGIPGAVTIATNMAGRGTDIVLGGNLEAQIAALGEHTSEEQVAKLRKDWEKGHQQVIDAGGLHIIGSERHESRRIDNQLRGRSGRQGDPGSSRFYLSLQDNLMRIFASERVSSIMKKLGMEKDEALEHPWVTKTVEHAQRRVEGFNFDIRKQLLEYDNVANEQRKVIYQQRSDLLSEDDVSETIEALRDDVVEDVVFSHIPPQSFEEQWDLEGLKQQLASDFGISFEPSVWFEDESHHAEDLPQHLIGLYAQLYEERQRVIDSLSLRQLEKSILLQSLDKHWREHLANMDHLRQGIHLRGYAQKNPKQEYKREAFELFEKMLDSIKYEVITLLLTIQIRTEHDAQAVEDQRRRSAQSTMEFQHEESSAMPSEEVQNETQSVGTVTRNQPKVGRNEPCPCGSGKKFKQCHGKLVLV